MPLVRDDEEQPSEEQPQQDEAIQQIGQKTVETSASFKKMLFGVGNWLARRKLPDSVKKGMKDEWHYVMTGERPKNGNRQRAKVTSGPFKSFGPKEKKKGKL